jgi:hypothetical protein
MGIVHRYTQTRHRALSLLADACTSLRAISALVQTTVGIQMFKVPCTADANAAELFHKRTVLRALGGHWKFVQRRQLLWRIR